MELQKFIEKSVCMLSEDFSETQIRDEVYRYVFGSYVPNMTINAAISTCMEIYAEIIKRHISSQRKDDDDNEEDVYCMECGQDERDGSYKYHRTLANGDEWYCENCKAYHMHQKKNKD